MYSSRNTNEAIGWLHTYAFSKMDDLKGLPNSHSTKHTWRASIKEQGSTVVARFLSLRRRNQFLRLDYMVAVTGNL
jgi:hypothetical protein